MSDNPNDDPGDPQQPETGHDSRVEDWHGQSVDRDAELADRLSDELGEEQAEAEFDRRATGKETQAQRHGDSIDPEQGESAYRDKAD
ncbi:hypothetical protein [Ilumatobacter nonamiensis]|uniref:hypothetical protein n=1 Tax=Ilumatobacter nonamiensis TaxID=467093 RepID=UPI0003485B3A|nr:hypothetical protein [Ilumatobacter nonamiensis]